MEVVLVVVMELMIVRMVISQWWFGWWKLMTVVRPYGCNRRRQICDDCIRAVDKRNSSRWQFFMATLRWYTEDLSKMGDSWAKMWSVRKKEKTRGWGLNILIPNLYSTCVNSYRISLVWNKMEFTKLNYLR